MYMGRISSILAIVCCLSGSLIGAPAAFADDLFTVLELAMRNDPSLRQAEAQFRARQTQLPLSRAALLPSINLGGSTTRQTAGPSSPIRGPTGNIILDEHSFRPGENSHRWGLNLTQSVVNLAAWYSYQSARDNNMALEMNFAGQEQDLIIRVAAAYFNILRAIESLETSRQEEEAAQRQLERTRQREEVGLIAITEVYESQAAYDLSRNNTILGEDTLASRYEALQAITGQSHPNLYVLREDFPIISAEGDVESWTEEALNNNLQLLAARYIVDAQSDVVKARRSDHLPTIALQAGYNHNVTGGSTSAEGFQRASGALDSTALTLSISVPLFSGGAISARRQAAEFDLQANQENVNLTRRQVTQDVRNSFRRVNTDALVVAQRQQAITSAQSALDAIEVGYEVGTRNIVDVLQARQQLFVALRNFQDAKYNYVIDTLILKQNTGLLTPQDIIDLNQWLENEPATAQ